MERIMQINAGSKFGGVSAMIYNFYKHIDRTLLQFDFVAPYLTSFDLYKKEIENMGGKIIELGIQGSFLSYNVQLFFKILSLCKERKYNIVHIHSGYSLFNFVVALAAKFAGVKKIIVHSHNAGNVTKKDQIYAVILAPMLNKIATYCLACSHLAGEYMYSKKIFSSPKFQIINNGIEIEKYIFCQNYREKIREQFHLESNFVVGHVGRFSEQKNHLFLLKIFKKVHQINNNARLLLIGTGELEQSIHAKARELEIEEYIIYTGLVKNTNEMYSAMDVFVLPSLFEGLPVVGVEAQASGLKCIFSSEITLEVCLLKESKRLDLNNDINIWVNEILKEDKIDRNEAGLIIQNLDFDINSVVNILEKIYLE